MESGQRRQPYRPQRQCRGGHPDSAVGRHGNPARGGSRPPESRSENAGMHKPARPRRGGKFHPPANRKHRPNFLQTRRADSESRRNAGTPPSALHTAHRPRVHRPPRKSEAHHKGRPQQSVVRNFHPGPRTLPQRKVPGNQPQQRVADGNGRVPAFQRNDPRRRGQSPHSALPRNRRQSTERQVRQHEKPTALQRGERRLRHEGFPPPPRFYRTRIQKQPDAPHQTDARKFRVEKRQT